MNILKYFFGDNLDKEEPIYFKNRQYEIADVIEEKCINALQHKHTTKATLFIGLDHMYELCLTCDQIIKNGDIIQTPFAELKVLTNVRSAKILEVVPDE